MRAAWWIGGAVGTVVGCVVTVKLNLHGPLTFLVGAVSAATGGIAGVGAYSWWQS